MSVYVKRNKLPQILHGNYALADVYLGTTHLAGWEYTDYTGTEFNVSDTFNMPVKVKSIYGCSVQYGMPSVAHPLPIFSRGESGTIYIIGVDENGDYYSSMNITVPNGLPGIPVSSGATYYDYDDQGWLCDEIDLERGKYIRRIAVMDHYSGYRMSEDFLSETGELTIGAKVLFKLPTPAELDLDYVGVVIDGEVRSYYPGTAFMSDGFDTLSVSTRV